MKNLCSGTQCGGFQFLLILDLWGISFNAVIVFGLGKDFLFKSVLGHCDVYISIDLRSLYHLQEYIQWMFYPAKWHAITLVNDELLCVSCTVASFVDNSQIWDYNDTPFIHVELTNWQRSFKPKYEYILSRARWLDFGLDFQTRRNQILGQIKRCK